MYLKRATTGFSLTELMVVITVIVVLASFMLPTYRGIVQKAEAVKCASNLRQIHTAMMLFYADYHFFPLGYTEGNPPETLTNLPGKWSPIRHRYNWGWYTGGVHTNWQIELAKYIGEGVVQYCMYDPTNPNYYNWVASYANYKLVDPATAPGYEYDWRLPIEYRCPGYTKKLLDPAFDEDGRNQGYRHKLSHYGYCYNSQLATGNGSLSQTITQDENQHRGRDPRMIVTDYATPNSSPNTLFFFCSRWGSLYPKVNTLNESDFTINDITGLSVAGAEPFFKSYPSAAPSGRSSAQAAFCGVAIGIHNGKDNCLFADGHIENLDPKNLTDRKRMNKTWYRPLPRDGSYGCYYSDGTRAYVAFGFDDNTGYPTGAFFSDGTWVGATPPANYDWNR